MQNTVVIDSFPESARSYRKGCAIVVVDVIRATTSAITIADKGGRCFPVPTIDAALRLATRLKNPLLAGEINGEIAPGFEITNSPVELASRDIADRPVILLSSSGTRLIHEAKGSEIVHLACFRNCAYVASHLDGRYSRVAVIGAGSRGEFRKEDQMCCAWITRDLIAAGYTPENERTIALVNRWETEGPEAVLNGRSAGYLRRSGQIHDLEFVLSHINDLSAAFVVKHGEVIGISGNEPLIAPTQIATAEAL